MTESRSGNPAYACLSRIVMKPLSERHKELRNKDLPLAPGMLDWAKLFPVDIRRALEPDTYIELPFVWPESPAKARNASKGIPPPPIVELVTKKPWLLANLYSGRIPHGEV